MSLTQLLDECLWWQGPKFLQEHEGCWPETNVVPESELPNTERRKQFEIHTFRTNISTILIRQIFLFILLTSLIGLNCEEEQLMSVGLFTIVKLKAMSAFQVLRSQTMNFKEQKRC